MAKKNNIKKEELIEVLQRIPEADLRSFLKKVINEPAVKVKFLKTFEPYFLNKESAKVYIEQIIEAFCDAQEDYNYIPFKKQSGLSSQMYDILEVAETFRNKGNFEAAIDICFEIAREAAEALENTDDSYGYIGGLINYAFTILQSLIGDKTYTLDEDGREAFIDACWDCIDEEVFKGWDWHLYIYKFLYHLANCEEEYEDILDNLENDPCLKSDYYQSERMKLKQEMLSQWKGTEAGEQFVRQNLQIPEFRELTIQDALQNANYQRAYQLCQEGILQDKGNSSLTNKWYQWKLKTAQQEGDKEMIIETASYLLLSVNILKDEYYQLLKKMIPAEEWLAFISQLAEKALPLFDKLYLDICAKEKWTERIYSFLQKNSYITTFFHYEPLLLPKYREELIDLYIQHALNMMEKTDCNRMTYQELCSLLQRAIRIGGSEKVDKAKAELQTKYKKCRALLDELSHM